MSNAQLPKNDPTKVLVVDDDTDIQESLSSYLSMEGFEVRTAGDGRMAIDVWKDWQPTIVLLDRQMPIMDGLETIRQMRIREADAGSPRTIIVSISGSLTRFDEPMMKGLGFDGYLPKPFRLKQLLLLMERLALGCAGIA